MGTLVKDIELNQPLKFKETAGVSLKCGMQVLQRVNRHVVAEFQRVTNCQRTCNGRSAKHAMS
jgi:hypothetical protein